MLFPYYTGNRDVNWPMATELEANEIIQIAE